MGSVLFLVFGRREGMAWGRVAVGGRRSFMVCLWGLVKVSICFEKMMITSGRNIGDFEFYSSIMKVNTDITCKYSYGALKRKVLCQHWIDLPEYYVCLPALWP